MATSRRAKRIVSRTLLVLAFSLVLVGYLLNRRTVSPDLSAVAAYFHGQLITQGLQPALAPLIAKPDRPVSITDLPLDLSRPATQAVGSALAVYPPGFVDKLVHRIALAGQITLWNTQVGGFFVADAIALNAHDVASSGGETFLADSFHHELSSIVRNQVLFNVSDWTANNPVGFAYASLDEYKRILAQRPPVDGDDALHTQGFVSLYGTTSLDNDWNTYAEQVFGHPRDLADEIRRFPRMRDKTRQLLNVYRRLDPRFGPLFDATGLSQTSGVGP